MPDGPFVWAANHHSWWDGFLAGAILDAEQRPAALLMDGTNLGRFGFLDSIGVVSSARPRAALDSLRDGRVMVIFPEGDLMTPGPLRPLARGAAWLAEHAAVPLVPVAVRVVARGHQHSEAYADFGSPTADLATDLAQRLATLDADLAAADPRQPPAGFRPVVRGRSSWDERITRLSRNRP